MPDQPLQRLRVDHIGSLLRPKALIDAFLAHGRKAIDRETLDQAADEAIRKVVAHRKRSDCRSSPTASSAGSTGR